MEDLVSIIVPVYNVEQYLPRCVESLINQTYKNLEIILVDDGSKDESGSICEDYSKADSRITVLHKKNEGLGITRNRGIEIASGDYLSFVDSDDFLPLDAIEGMLNEIRKCGSDLVIGNYYYGEKIKNTKAPECCYYGQDIFDYVLVHFLGNWPKEEDMISVAAWGKLYRKDIIQKYNLRFPSERELIWEDIVFNLDYVPRCNSVYVSRVPRYYYCFNENSLTHKYNENKLQQILKMYEYVSVKVDILKLPEAAKTRIDNSYIGHIRTCLKLEVLYAKQNGFRNAYNNIKKICDDQRVVKLLEGFPDSYYSFVQKLYSHSILGKKYLVVFFLTWLQLKRKRID